MSAEEDLKEFEVTFDFSMSAETRCLTIKAKDAEDALIKCRQSIDKNGCLDNGKFRSLGGDDRKESWRASAGTDFEYRIDEGGIVEIGK